MHTLTTTTTRVDAFSAALLALGRACTEARMATNAYCADPSEAARTRVLDALGRVREARLRMDAAREATR